jgi:hypothetical protein
MRRRGMPGESLSPRATICQERSDVGIPVCAPQNAAGTPALHRSELENFSMD